MSLIKKCLQNGDAKLTLQYCQEMLVVEPKQIQILLFAAIASRSLGWLDDAIDFIHRAMAVAPNLPGIHSILGDIMLQKKPEPALQALLKELGTSATTQLKTLLTLVLLSLPLRPSRMQKRILNMPLRLIPKWQLHM